MYQHLLATDMDGTFLTEEHYYDRNRLQELLDKGEKKGYLFVAASGRSLQSLQALFSEVNNRIAFVADNGSVVVYKGQVLFEDDPIAPTLYLDLVEAIAGHSDHSRLFLTLSGRQASYMLDTSPEELLDAMSAYYTHNQLVTDFTQIEEDILKINLVCDHEKMEAMQTWLHARFPSLTAVTTGFNSLDIIPSGINKGRGLELICQHLGLEKEAVTAFGDNQNDMEMLAFAGRSFATKNAVAAVKEQADNLLGHCNDQVVLACMEEIIDGD